MSPKKEIENLFKEKGFSDYKWINPEEIVVSRWVRMKCMYGCPNFGKSASCPPNNPSVDECERFIREYQRAVIFHFQKRFENPADRKDWTSEIDKRLSELEREVFLAGYERVFLLAAGSCHLCDDCTLDRKSCKYPNVSRPTPEGMAVDVFTTVKRVGYPIAVLRDYSEKMNRYAFMMLE
ncbi:MAG: DUF2284 domain-containing protein [Candidatus Odinarchaeota archaeon]